MPIQADTPPVMKSVLVLSPHLDDAAFSVGPLIAEFSDSVKFTVATAFTKSVLNPTEFALACQLDKGLSFDCDYMQIRRDEDIAWCQQIAALYNHGPFAEAPHRGYTSAEELFGLILSSDDLQSALSIWLADMIKIAKPDAILCPLGVGDHVDHRLIRKTAELLQLKMIPLLFFKEQPYASKLDNFSLTDYVCEPLACAETQLLLTEESINQAKAAASAYKSQIAFQFGTINKMHETLRKAWSRNFSLYQAARVSGVPDFFFRPEIGLLCQD